MLCSLTAVGHVPHDARRCAGSGPSLGPPIRLLSLACALWLVAVTTSASTQAPSSCSEACTDRQPPGEYSCDDQKRFGKCWGGWMLDGGFCDATCDRCTFCPRSQQQQRSPVPSKAEDAGAGGSCTDDAPPESKFTCAEQRALGKCLADWMLKSNACQVCR